MSPLQSLRGTPQVFPRPRASPVTQPAQPTTATGVYTGVDPEVRASLDRLAATQRPLELYSRTRAVPLDALGPTRAP